MFDKSTYIVILLILALLFSGCATNGLLPDPSVQVAQLNITFDPNPVPYDSSWGGWWFFVISISESNGVAVDIESITVEFYNWSDELVNTEVWDITEITFWFGTASIAPDSTIYSDVSSFPDTSKYVIMTVEGIDSNDNKVQTTGRMDFLPQVIEVIK